MSNFQMNKEVTLFTLFSSFCVLTLLFLVFVQLLLLCGLGDVWQEGPEGHPRGGGATFVLRHLQLGTQEQH